VWSQFYFVIQISGTPSLHWFDAILRPAGKSWVNGLVPFYAKAPTQTRFAPLAEVDADPNTYAMSEQAYEAQWQPITKQYPRCPLISS